MLCIILEATLHEKHNGAGEGREVKRAEPRVQAQGRSGTVLPPGSCAQMLSTRNTKQGSDVVTHICDPSTWRPA